MIVVSITPDALNAATNTQITNVEALSASDATASVTIDLQNQTEFFMITGSSFNDTITGGAGAGDTVIFSGNRADYAITLNGSTYTVTDSRAGSSTGTDTVTGVENFQFADATFTTATLDAVPPTVTVVAYGTNDGTLKAGDSVELLVTFSENVTVVGGTPSLVLNSGGTATFTRTVRAAISCCSLTRSRPVEQRRPGRHCLQSEWRNC